MGNDRITPTTHEASVASVTDMESARTKQKWEGLKAQRADEERRALSQEIEELKQLLAETETKVGKGEDIAFAQFERAEAFQKEAKESRRRMEEIGRQNASLLRELEERFDVMKRQILGWEIFKARLMNVLIDQGLNPQNAMPQNEEEELIAGRMPEGLSYANLEYILAEHRSALCFEEAEVDQVLDALFAEAEEAMPDPPRTVRSQPVPKPDAPVASDGKDAFDDFVVEFTSEPRPRSIPPESEPESEDDASTEEGRPRQNTLGYEELNPFNLAASAPPIPLLKPAQEDPEVPDHAWDEEPETNHSLTIGFDPRFDPDEPPSRAAILPPSEMRPEGWRPPEVKPMMVVRSADPEVRRRTEERAKHRK